MSGPVATGVFASPLGPLRASATDSALRSLSFVDEDAPVPARGAHGVLDGLERELRAYFGGELRAFRTPVEPLGTGFQRRVWDALMEIPFGETWSYARLAARVGSNARAVGGANGRNPVAIVIPCHRVIGADGSLTGYGGGIDRKERLLALEGALLGRG